jgi:hypothetical protein
MPTKNPTISLILICVNEFYVDLAIKFLNHFKDDSVTQIFVFTDDSSFLVKLNNSSAADRIELRIINNSKWPYPSLDRFDYFVELKNDIKTELVLYVDVDLIFNKPIKTGLLRQIIQENKLCFAVHPGYLFSSFDYVRKRNIPFELNSLSLAYVRNSFLHRYVYGAFILGPSKLFLDMSGVLKDQINKDKKLNYIAVWHDESHLNSWRVRNRAKSLVKLGIVWNLPYPSNKVLNSIIKPNFYCFNKGTNFERL